MTTEKISVRPLKIKESLFDDIMKIAFDKKLYKFSPTVLQILEEYVANYEKEKTSK